MKYVFCISLACLLSVHVVAQNDDYRPFVEEGKVWKVERYSIADTQPQWTKEYFFSGDTVVGGMACKRWMCRWDNEEEYVGALCESDKRVFLFLPGSNDPKLLYDFGVSVGDRMSPYDTSSCLVETCMVTHILDVTSLSHPLRCIRFCTSNDDESPFDFTWNVWMEGIGTKCSPIINLCNKMGLQERLMECSVNGVVIYTESDNPVGEVHELVLGIDAPSTPQMVNGKSVNSKFLDLSGRRLSASPTRPGVYLLDGRKVLVK